MYTIDNLLNSGSKSMNVNGSSVNKTFSFAPSTTYYIYGLTCVFKDDGTTSLNKFGAGTALTHGIDIQVTIAGTTSLITTIKDNSDLCTRFHWNQFGSGAVLSILGIVTPEGFGASNNIFIGYIDFINAISLNSGDLISTVIKDDLTGINVLEMASKGVYA